MKAELMLMPSLNAFAIAWNRCAWRRRNMRWQVDLSALVHKWQRWGEVTMAVVIVSR